MHDKGGQKGCLQYKCLRKQYIILISTTVYHKNEKSPGISKTAQKIIKPSGLYRVFFVILKFCFSIILFFDIKSSFFTSRTKLSIMLRRIKLFWLNSKYCQHMSETGSKLQTTGGGRGKWETSKIWFNLLKQFLFLSQLIILPVWGAIILGK